MGTEKCFIAPSTCILMRPISHARRVPWGFKRVRSATWRWLVLSCDCTQIFALASWGRVGWNIFPVPDDGGGGLKIVGLAGGLVKRNEP